ncbi:hypothetical protein [Alkalicoccobacillus plakortidis]|uniref:Uncharacterized protein n=1 Tax=Alkalicoccobacillus plakortidis TaxID=444060 RepID=A0ABT0XGT4_9BACI|nr:hypothetical protein [Alkalicoccobacillus plakortidis]MCM2675121.1 hypothetical protein [Alkalicoccobacillus plakortidis]
MNIHSDKLLAWIKKDSYLYSAYHYIRLNMNNQDEALHFMYHLYIENSPILLNGFHDFLANEQKS